MGVGLCAIFERRVPGIPRYAYEGKDLASAWPAIDELARRLGLTPIEDFYDPGLDDEEDEDDADEEVGDFTDPRKIVPKAVEGDDYKPLWFPACDGLRTVTGLLQYLTSHPAEFDDTEGVIIDLEGIQEILTGAVEADIRFRFDMLP